MNRIHTCVQKLKALEFVRVTLSDQNTIIEASVLLTVVASDYDVRELKKECLIHLNLYYQTASDGTSEKS